jgi:hypothetical protein
MISAGKFWHSTVLHNRALSARPRDAPTPDKKNHLSLEILSRDNFYSTLFAYAHMLGSLRLVAVL